MDLEKTSMDLNKEEECIIGEGNFSIKTVDDIARVLMTSASEIKVGVAMNDAGMRITRVSGNDEELKQKSAEKAHEIGAGHAFIILIKEAFPVNILNDLMNVHGVCTIHAASANDMKILLAETDQGKSIIGVVDGQDSTGIEDEDTVKERRKTLKNIGYHLG